MNSHEHLHTFKLHTETGGYDVEEFKCSTSGRYTLVAPRSTYCPECGERL